MSIIRAILRVIILVVDTLFKPKLAVLPAEQQARLAQATQGMSLYQFEACPFCVKVRWAMRRLGIDIPLKDAKNDNAHKQELLEGGGRVKVPCLRTQSNGQDHWLYESDAINAHLATLVEQAKA